MGDYTMCERTYRLKPKASLAEQPLRQGPGWSEKNGAIRVPHQLRRIAIDRRLVDIFISHPLSPGFAYTFLRYAFSRRALVLRGTDKSESAMAPMEGGGKSPL